MKAVICLLALSTVLAQSAVLDRVSTRQNLNIGIVSEGDRLLSSWNLSRTGLPGAIVSHTLVYSSSVIIGITAIHVNEVGDSQGANVFITEGGLNHNNVTIVLQSQRGYGYNYQVDIWGKDPVPTTPSLA